MDLLTDLGIGLPILSSLEVGIKALPSRRALTEGFGVSRHTLAGTEADEPLPRQDTVRS